MSKENCILIENDMYVVTDEAGFDEAIDEFWKNNTDIQTSNDPYKSSPHDSRIYEYPLIVMLSLEHLSQPYVRCRIIPYKKFSQKTKHIEKTVEDIYNTLYIVSPCYITSENVLHRYSLMGVSLKHCTPGGKTGYCVSKRSLDSTIEYGLTSFYPSVEEAYAFVSKELGREVIPQVDRCEIQLESINGNDILNYRPYLSESFKEN